MEIQYSHCVKYTHGKPDRYPFSEYVWKTEDVTIWKHRPDPMRGFPEEHFTSALNNAPFGYGDTLDDVIGNARYRLMDLSRTIAEEQSRLSQLVDAAEESLIPC